MTKSPKVILKCRFDYAIEHPDNHFSTSDISARNKIGGMYNYFSNVKKRAMNMFDYFEGKINKVEKVNLILENGEYATQEEVEKRKQQYLNYFKKSNLWQCILSFDNDFVNDSIELRELEKKIAKEVLPRFFRKCGFKDVKKLSYQLALHTNTKHYHFHISFIEKEPNYICSDGSIKYRRKGMFSSSEKNFLKNEVIHMIERHKEFTPLIVTNNKNIEEIKKYFKSNSRNYILNNYDDLILEENILRLGQLISKYRKEKNLNGNKVKYNSIYDKEIKDLTKNIKDYLFKNKKSDLYKKNNEFKQSLNDINKYFNKLNKENHIKSRFKSEYSKEKEKYVDNYVYNVIVNHALSRYNYLKRNKKSISEEDLIQEVILKMYKNNAKQSKYDILINYLKNTSEKLKYKNRYKIEESIKNINSEMNEAMLEFSKLFQNENSNYYN